MNILRLFYFNSKYITPPKEGLICPIYELSLRCSIENYIGFSQFDTQTFTFIVDIIGPSTQEFTADGVFPIDVYAVDNQGNISTV